MIKKEMKKTTQGLYVGGPGQTLGQGGKRMVFPALRPSPDEAGYPATLENIKEKLY